MLNKLSFNLASSLNDSESQTNIRKKVIIESNNVIKKIDMTSKLEENQIDDAKEDSKEKGLYCEGEEENTLKYVYYPDEIKDMLLNDPNFGLSNYSDVGFESEEEMKDYVEDEVSKIERIESEEEISPISQTNNSDFLGFKSGKVRTVLKDGRAFVSDEPEVSLINAVELTLANLEEGEDCSKKQELNEEELDIANFKNDVFKALADVAFKYDSLFREMNWDIDTYRNNFQDSVDYFMNKFFVDNIPDEDDLDESEENKLNEAVFEVDVAFEDIDDYHNEEEVIAAVKDWLGDLANEVKVKVESFEGPGAGWPIVSLTGDKEKIGEFLNKNYNSGDDTLEDTYEMYLISESDKLEERINDGDFIIYRSTVEGPLYISGPTNTSFKKEEAVRYPTEEEAKEALHEYIEAVVDPEANSFKVARINESAELNESNSRPMFKDYENALSDDFKKAFDIGTYEDGMGDLDITKKGRPVGSIYRNDDDKYEVRLKRYIKGTKVVDTWQEAVEILNNAVSNTTNESEEVKENDKLTEAEEKISVKNLKTIKSQGNIFMLEDDNKQIIVGENFNESDKSIENAEVYKDREEANKDYLGRCDVTKDGKKVD